jgi:hypothetical protein
MEVTHTAVVVLTKEHKINGYIDLMPGARLTDYITSVKAFFALTEVVVEDIRSGKVIFRSKFANVNRDSVELIMPVEFCEDCR